MLLVLIVNGLAALMVRHKTKQTVNAGVADLQHHVFGALGKPLCLDLGLRHLFAITLLLLRLKLDEGLRVVWAFFDKVFDLGVFGVLFWFFFWFTHVLEARLAVWASKSSSKLDRLFVPQLGKSLRIVVLVVGIIFALLILNLPRHIPAFSLKALASC